MALLNAKQIRKLKPSRHYAQFAKLFRERGLEVQDDDYELIDMAIRECDRLLDLRNFLGG